MQNNQHKTVTIYISNGWFSTFLVDGNTIVDTVDIYTYQCKSCSNNIDCQHVKSVINYIEEQLDLYCNVRKLEDDISVMSNTINKLKDSIIL